MAEGFRGVLPFIGVGGALVRLTISSVGGSPVASLGKAAPAGTLLIGSPFTLTQSGSFGAKALAAPSGSVLLASTAKGYKSHIFPFIGVQGDAPIPTYEAGLIVSIGKAGVAGALEYPTGVAGFLARPFIGISGTFTPVAMNLGSVSVGALGLSGLTGETVPPDEVVLEEYLEVGARGRSAVAGTLALTGASGFVLGSLSVAARGRAAPTPDLLAIKYGYAISAGLIGARAFAGIPTGNIFQPISFSLGSLVLAAKGFAAPFAYAVGQPAFADFALLESGAYGMPTTVNIWNMALSHIGSKHFVESETERSREVSVLKVHWAAAVNKVLADHTWTFARKYGALGLITVSPNADWAYAYRYPADCVFARRLVTETGGRRDPKPPPFVIGQDNWGRIIYTDMEDAVLEYTMRVFETERYDPQFVTMLSWYLAHLIASPLSRIADAARVCFAMYNSLLDTAAATSMNESQQDEPQEAEWIQAR